MLGNIWIALVVTLGLALLWLRFNDFLAHRGMISSRLSRKLIHIGTGPIFVLCWLLFPNLPQARFLAALIPFMITAQFALVGLGVIKDPEAVAAMSRTGDRREILLGPLFYGIVFVVLTLLYWKDTPSGIIALMLLCGGDGLADVVGRRVKSAPIPWSKQKSIAGTTSVLVGGWILAVGVIWVYTTAGIFPGGLAAYLPGITVISLAGALVESLPFNDIDNLTVPLAAVLLGMFLFK